MKTKRWLIPAAFFLLFGGMQTSVVFAGGRGEAREGHSDIGGMHEGFRGDHDDRGFGHDYDGPRGYIGPSWGLYGGFGWDYPWTWGSPYYYPVPPTMEVHHVDYGTLVFKVKPANTKVFVDNAFIGTVKSLDHHEAYVKEGNHDIKLEAPDGSKLDRTIFVAAGKKIKLVDTL